MATYAAYKHVELYNVGKAKKRVLKPPGGGSSDIFGNQNAPATPRTTAKNHMSSNIFAAPENRNGNGHGHAEHRRYPNQDSHNRLFGEVERPYTPAKNLPKSNIPIGSDALDSPKQSTTNGKINGHSNGSSNGHSNGHNTATGDSAIANGNGLKNDETNKVGNNSINHTDNLSDEMNLENKSTEIIYDKGTNESNLDESSSQLNQEVIDTETNNEININNLHAATNNIENKTTLTATTSTTNSTETALLQSNATSPSKTVTSTSSNLNTPSSEYSSASSNSFTVPLKSPRIASRNPVTGDGIECLMRKPRRMDLHKDGNPVTGEGYKAEINMTVPSLNGAKQVINKNRVPPGGFSSGLW